jgi:hypothetical protein
MPYGIVGTLILVLDIYCIYLILTGGGDPGMKLLWVIIVLLLPLLGPILYFVIGRGKLA